MTQLDPWRMPDHQPLDLVLAAVSEAFGFTVAELAARDRHRRLAWARQVAMALLYENNSVTLHEAGKLFHRDHGTVLHAVRAVSALTSAHPALAAAIEKIREKVRAGTNQPSKSNAT